MTLIPRSCLAIRAVVLTLSLIGSASAAEGPLVLWYQQPAAAWTEALPVGNGRLGGMVFGGVSQERIQLNDAAGQTYRLTFQ